MRTHFGTLMVVALLLGGCATMSDTERRLATGAGAGAATGAIIGSFSGSAGTGALIGTAVGAAGGYLYDQHKKSEEDAYNRGYSAGAKRH